MRFRLGFSLRPHPLAADKNTDIGILAWHLAVRQLGKIQGLQQMEGFGKVGMQGSVAGGIVYGVGNHNIFV